MYTLVNLVVVAWPRIRVIVVANAKISMVKYHVRKRAIMTRIVKDMSCIVVPLVDFPSIIVKSLLRQYVHQYVQGNQEAE